MSLRDQRPFLNDTTAFSPDLSAAADELHAALPTINPALEIGAPVLRRSIALDGRLQGAMGALRDLTRRPSTNLAVRALNGAVTTLQPQLRCLGPVQTVCDYWNYFWTFLSEHISEEVPGGLSQRALLNTNGQQMDSTGSAGAIHPANGKGYVDNPLNNARGSIEFLHGQPYGAAITSTGAADCENGQRGYPMGRLSQFAPKGYFIVTDPNTPGAQGPTYAGRRRARPSPVSRSRETGRHEASAQPRAEGPRGRGNRRGGDRDRHVLRLHEGQSVRPSLPAQGRLSHLEQRAQGLSRADRRRQRRQGREARPSLGRSRGLGGDDGDRPQGPADPLRRHAPLSPRSPR